MEAGSFPSSHIPTTGATVTRAADSVTIDVSKIWNASEGTIICESDFGPTTGVDQNSLDGNSGQRTLLARGIDGTLRVLLASNWVVGPTGGPANSGRARFAVSLSPTGRVAINGAVVSSHTQQPNPTTLGLGPLNGTIQSLQYHRFAFDDVSLQAASVLN